MDINNYNNFNFGKLLTEPIKYVIEKIYYSVTFLSPIKNESYKRHVNYSINDYIIGIIDVLKTGVSWQNYNKVMKGDTLRKKHNEWVKLGIYDYAYKLLLEEYLKKQNKTEELKFQSIDSTFVEDINGSKDAGYNYIYKRRKGESSKGIKITSIVTTSGIPISITTDSGNKYDSPLLPNAINNIVTNCNTYKYRNHNRYKQYILADKGYDSKNNFKILQEKGYIPLIPQNKKNTKNKKLLRKFNKQEKKVYKKRNIIENYHSWIKKFPKIKCLHEHKIEYYKGLLLLGISIIISRRINKS
jgi:hypothetical protein